MGRSWEEDGGGRGALVVVSVLKARFESSEWPEQ